MKSINLNGIWTLGICTQEEYKALHANFCTLQQLKNSGIRLLSGHVPGNYEIDLEENGVIENPFFGKNPLQSLDREMDHLFYARTFDFQPEQGKDYLLSFEGIDTIADIYLNGSWIARTENMLMEHILEIEGDRFRTGENELLVHIIPVSLEARKYDNPLFQNGLKYEMDSLNIRKSPYMFGWDIFPRMLSGGIWRSVTLTEKPQYAFLQSYLFTRNIEKDYSKCELEYFFEIELNDLPYHGFEIEVEGSCGTSRFLKKWDVWSKAGHFCFEVPSPALWWPRRTGEPNLYQVEARLVRNGEVYARKNFRFGIRTVELKKTSLTDEDGNGEFCFRVNHRKIFILGTNWVPLDSLPSRGRERIDPSLELVTDLNCNMVRCWGGGYYEDNYFYDRCDELGILVWQDFMEACGLYPENREFLQSFEEEVTYQVRRLRQHPCIALWSGDNENDSCYGWSTNYRLDPNQNLNTRAVIPQVLRMNDYIRDYLPSSPYMDETAYLSQKGDSYLPEQHLWGPRDYYKGDFYRNSLAHFASETGYHGCPNVESIKKFISPDALWPYTDNGEWLLHASSPTMKPDESYAYRIQLMADQIKVLFGSVPDNLEEFSLLSQISQAEAKKYFIERFRIGKWRRTGIIWWNVVDGCPQFSDAVVDYYFCKKLAYNFIKRSQEMVCLMCDEPEGGNVSLVGSNDYATDKQVSFKVTDLACGDIVWEGSVVLPADSSIRIASLDTRERTAFFLIEWIYDDISCRNHYVTWEAPFDKEKYIQLSSKAMLI